MMKQTFLIILLFGLISCNQQTDNNRALQNRIDSLESKLDNVYKPGFGDLMGTIQVHHNKLWFAGKNQNWKLADFEIHEIIEAFEDIKKYQKNREETKKIDMIQPPLENINTAIQKKDPVLFKEGYTLLTNSCNSCHSQTGYEFILVKNPDFSSFSNQEFKLQSEK
ncbi:MAG: hypothetical protein ABIN48_12195 [Ginsengibacter sp.]